MNVLCMYVCTYVGAVTGALKWDTGFTYCTQMRETPRREGPRLWCIMIDVFSIVLFQKKRRHVSQCLKDRNHSASKREFALSTIV